MSNLLKVKDRTGFPMIWVEPIEAYLHWLPVSKIQLEHFICHFAGADFNAEWYDGRLQENARVSPQNVRTSNYWGAFASGLVPSEVKRLARWMGEGYAIPTHDEWFKAFCYLKERPFESTNWPETLEETSSRVLTLMQAFDSVASSLTQNSQSRQTLADQMFMRKGVIEWVSYGIGRHEWGGYGETHSEFRSQMFSPDHGHPLLINRPEIDRLYFFGCRLLRRP